MTGEPKRYEFELPSDGSHAAWILFGWIDDGKKILEIGCASGVQTRYLREQRHCHVTGVEINPEAADLARPYCDRVIVGSIEDAELVGALEPGEFDVITFMDVLEHLNDPGATLKRIGKLLASTGTVVASIPNIAHAAICWELAHGRFDYQKYGLLDDTHVRFFTKKGVLKLFADAGFEVAELARVSKVPEETEFEVKVGSAQDEAFLEYIRERNAEAATYQFVVRAKLRGRATEDLSIQASEAQDVVNKLTARLKALERENAALQSQISWLEEHRFGPLARIVNAWRSR